MSKGHVLVICEKPDAARRIALALSDGCERSVVNGVTVYRLNWKGEEYVIFPALGHLYGVSDPSAERRVYPVLDVEWMPLKGRRGVEERIELAKELSRGAKGFVNACDFDLEGETIGYNVLKYACGGKHGSYLRAKFSTLTREELREAFSKLDEGLGKEMAVAGRTRHLIDFLYGVNLSRALSEAYYRAKGKYRVFSTGRVQGPTLGFLVEREKEIRAHVPIPYWKARAYAVKDGEGFWAEYPRKVPNLKVAERLKGLKGSKGVVSRKRASRSRIPPPTPFNTGDLQKEAYRAFGMDPSRTLRMAERLYLRALISYPRTSSQKLPRSIGYRRIIERLSKIKGYEDAKELLKRRLKPREGEKEDPAHPAIYPTGEEPKGLSPQERRIYDLIVRRFLACFCDPVVRESISIRFKALGFEFVARGGRILEEGWLKFYKFVRFGEGELPDVEEGDELLVKELKVEEKFEGPPARYNKASLLSLMEKEGIGTKATRADIIRTLIERGYVVEKGMRVTDIGFEVYEVMKGYMPEILSVEMTRRIEEELAGIESGERDWREVIREAVEGLLPALKSMKGKEGEVGAKVVEAHRRSRLSRLALGPCPVCKTGTLIVVKTRKGRFAGCTNYYKTGCRATAPLPGRGKIEPIGTCELCGWPVIRLRIGRWTKEFCINPNCERNRA